MKFQNPRGTRDFYPEEMAVRRHIEQAWRRASIDFGYDEIDGPTFEHLDLYTVKSGEGIVNELFSFTRAGGDDVYALRPEFTPTLARMVAAKGGALPLPIKWFAMPNFFRAERPQRGRLREFLQWNVDFLGVAGPAADAEVISVAVAALERLGLTPRDVQVRLSHRGAVAKVLASLGVPDERISAAFELLDRRDKLEPAEFATRCAAIGLERDGAARFESASRISAPLSALRAGDVPGLPTSIEDLAEVRAVADALDGMGLSEWCRLDLGIVRGLAYYTGTVFEVHEASGAERAVAGGGRYDGLVELFGGPKMPAIGFGMGDVVLGLLLQEKGLLGGADGAVALLPRADVFVISAGGDLAEAALPRLVAALRRDGLHARHSYRTTRNVGKLLGEAAKVRARFAVILGAELAEQRVALKDLTSGEQKLVAMDAIAAEIRPSA